MVNRVFLVTVLADALFVASGGIELGFSLIVGSQLGDAPTDGVGATRSLLYQRFPLTVGVINAGCILATFLVTLVGFLTPGRGWLKISGYLVMLCGLFTMCIGVFLWVMTLRLKENFASVYTAQDASVQELIQTSFGCCGYFNSTSPAFITDSTCPSPAAASLHMGCASSISTFSNIFLDDIFTALFGMVGVDALFILAIACLVRNRKERERYHHIDEKNGAERL